MTGDVGGRQRFAGRTVLITGAGSGIGRVMSEQFAAEGARVAVTDRLGDRAEETAAGIDAAGGSARALVMDVTDRAAVRETVAAVGPVDVLVNNAVHPCDTRFEDLTEPEWDAVVGTSLKGPFAVSQAVLPAMVERGAGAIVNIGSVNASAYLGNEAYSAAKAGLESLTRSLAVRYAPRGIRANLVAAGTIRTPVWSRRAARDPQILARLERWYPMGRVGRPEDVSAAVRFLASDEAGWITGAVLRVDGGLLAGSRPMTEDILGPGCWDGTAPG